MDDKDSSLLTHTQSSQVRCMTVSLPRLCLYFSLLMLVITYTNLAVACYTSFTCSRFLPTIDYLGCFRGHDRVYIVACVFYAVTLAVCVVGGHRRQQGALSDEWRMVTTSSGLLAALCLPVIAFFDEVNAQHWLPFPSIHKSALILFFPSAGFWVGASFLAIRRLEPAFTQSEVWWMKVLRGIVYLAGGLFLLTLVEWHFAYTVYSDALLNETGEAVCEWCLVALSILYPTVLCQFNRGYVLRFSMRLTESKDVELAQI